MKRIAVLGVNYRRTPVDVREKLYFSAGELPETLTALAGVEAVNEVMLLSTCNRTEAIFVSDDPARAADRLLGELAARKRLNPDQLRGDLYSYSGGAAVRHVFKVAAGLDSMVLGENEITGQFKTAYTLALAGDTADKVLLTLYQAAMAAVKKVKGRTAVSRGTVSVSHCAVGLARRALNGLEDKKVLVIGAGDMAHSAAVGFLKSGAKSVDVINKTYAKAAELAGKFNGTAYEFGSLGRAVENSDIILCSTSSPEPVVRTGLVAEALAGRRGRELFIVDIAVPRDVEAGVKDLAGVHLYDIDDLRTLTADAERARRGELEKAETILAECVGTFESELYMREAAALVGTVKEKVYAIAAEECAAVALEKGLGDGEKENLRAATRAVVDRVIRAHMRGLKTRLENGGAGKEGLLDAVRKAFIGS